MKELNFIIGQLIAAKYHNEIMTINYFYPKELKKEVYDEIAGRIENFNLDVQIKSSFLRNGDSMISIIKNGVIIHIFFGENFNCHLSRSNYNFVHKNISDKTYLEVIYPSINIWGVINGGKFI